MMEIPMPPTWAAWMLLGLNSAIMAWQAWEVRQVRMRWHEFANKKFGQVANTASFCVIALKEAGLWKVEYDEALRSQ